MMRTLFVALTAAVMTLVLGPTVMIARLLRFPHGPTSIYARSIRLWASSINVAAGIRVRVHGGEHLQQPHGAVLISNHVSWFDIFSLASVVPWCSFVAKAELRKIPLFGFAAECAGIVFLERENRKAAFESYKTAAQQVQKGRLIVVCPEGTRGSDYHLRPFKKGPFVLAIAAQSPVIPSVVHGTREIMPKGSFLIRSGVVDLHFLEPVATNGYDYEGRNELMANVWQQMADALRDIYGVQGSEAAIAGQDG